MRPAGQRDKLVRIERTSAAEDDHGEQVSDWAEIGREWSRVLFGTGYERRSGAVQAGAQPATFQVLDNSLTRDLTVRDRIVWNGMAWSIVGIAPISRGEIEITTLGVAL
ncbi:phage head completion protein [Novosphingobium gossypii]|uniref:phage head completion protein n=1 Tax=Novosphingobium gossypii TaxID=1604774 RepID=UPI003D1FAF07